MGIEYRSYNLGDEITPLIKTMSQEAISITTTIRTINVRGRGITTRIRTRRRLLAR